jgi:hypothetical protein
MFARVASICFAMIFLIGIVWFLNELDNKTIFAATLAIVSGLVVAAAPRSLFPYLMLKVVLLGLCTIGVLSLAYLMVGDIYIKNGPDWGAFIIRAMFATSFLSMANEIWNHAHSNQK